MENLINRGALILDYLERLGKRDGYKAKFEALSQAVDSAIPVDAEPVITGNTSDGYHTFNELYHHRAVLFSVIVKNYPNRCWKSKKHHDGSMYDGMFIVGINTPDGQATYHYDIDPYWDVFDCAEFDAAPEWDGHTPAQSIERIASLCREQPENRVLTLEDISNTTFLIPCFVEDRYGPTTQIIADILDRDGVSFVLKYQLEAFNDGYRRYADDYRKTWRCWERYPTEKERKAVPWE